jgi:excinuclease ABC subunit A
MHDVQLLLKVLKRLRDNGNTVIVIEHNMDVIKTGDWVIDLGPEGGSNGGEIIAMGSPEEIMNIKASHTGRHLKKEL